MVGLLACFPANADQGAAEIFQARCWKCHGEAQVSGLDLRSRESALRGGVHGKVIVPGSAENSRLYRLVAGERAAEFRLPHSVAVDSKRRVYVADRGNKRIQVFEPEGKFVTEWRVGTPYGLLFTGRRLWMTDIPAKRVMRIDEAGQVVEFCPTGTSRSDGSDLYVGPHLLATAPDGLLLVAQTTGVLSLFEKY
jgi:sugar lactone lactonase YvrE